MSSSEMVNAPWLKTPEDPAAILATMGVAGSWTIDGLGTAEWAMGKAGQAQRTLDELCAQYAEWKRMLDDWLVEASAPVKRTLEFFTGHLEAYAVAERERTGDATLKLPSGKVSTRRNQQAVVVVDEDQVLATAHDLMVPDDQGEMVPLIDLITTRKVALTKLRDRVKIQQRVLESGVWAFPCGHFQGAASWKPEDLTGWCPVCGAQEQPDPDGNVHGPRWTNDVETIVTTLTGDELLGATVRPEKITPTVSPATPGAERAQLLGS